MNTEQLKGNWNQLKGQIKEKWGDLTDDQIEAAKGNCDLLVGKIIEVYGVGKEAAQEQVNKFLKHINKKTGDEEGGESGNGSFSEQISHATDVVKENLGEASEAVVEYIKNKPFTSMAIGFGAGVLLSLLIRR
jgi:uncharacterized protein YjbJ (UPF0337 family)